MKKTYVLDTNVLLSDPNALFSFAEHNIIVPLVVLEELDNHKNRQDEIGHNARQVNRTLDDMRKKGNLCEGVTLNSGGIIRVVKAAGKEIIDLIPPDLKSDKVDNFIIAFMMHSSLDDAILVSKDVNVRIKCDSLNIKCEDYLKMRIESDTSKFYTGVVTYTNVDSTILDAVYDDAVFVSDVTDQKVYPNQIVILKGGMSESVITRCVDGERLTLLNKVDLVYGLKPKNKEQTFALDLLLNPEIKLVTLTGKSGCGKTLISLAAALEQLRSSDGSKPLYEKLIVTRPIQPVGKDIGFLPGTIDEKMEPWVAPIKDNLDFLVNTHKHGRREKPRRQMSGVRGEKKEDESFLSYLKNSGTIEIEAITFIRGRSIPNAIIIIDEAQNLSMHELKTIMTRVGEGTKVIVTGDVEQIDNSHVDVYTNGLTYAIEKFKEYAIAGHVTFLKGERSALATLSSEIL